MIDFDVFFFSEFCAEFLTGKDGLLLARKYVLDRKNATKKFRRNKEESLIYAYTKSFFLAVFKCALMCKLHESRAGKR